ncbi:MAG: chromosome segregation protein SMC [Clostridia bacterium]
MKLKKLELYGFKSFARKTEICFDSGITAIVGPNGSGKSNIADAIRWVLGEQSAKSLRGSSMEDVIFNGTDLRKAQGYSEVSLTFDNSDKFLASERDEVVITRRVYRTGSGEYFINSAPSRLKDIYELFRDTGIGKEGYSIIGQGRVEEILSNRSNERRNAFLEAAGVMKYRVRKEEAEHKLTLTRDNIARISDILNELVERLEPLRDESAKAQSFLKLRDELRELELNLFLYQFDKSTDKINAFNATIEQLTASVSEAESEKAEAVLGIAASESKEGALIKKISALNNELIELTGGIGATRGDLSVLKEKLATLNREIAELKERSNGNAGREAELLSAIAFINEGGEEAIEEIKSLSSALEEKTRTLDLLNLETGDKEDELERKKNQIIAGMNRLSDSKSQLSRLNALSGTINTQINAIGEKKEVLLSEKERLKNERDDREWRIVEAAQDFSESQKAVEAGRGAINDLKRDTLELDKAIMTEERELSGKKSRLKVISEMKQAYEGYYSSVRRLLIDAKQFKNLNVRGVVAEIISTDKKYETAVEMSLGGALQNVVTPSEEDGKRIIEHLRSHNYGRATILPISAVKSRRLDDNELYFVKQTPGVIGVMSDLVDYEPLYRSVIENLMGRTVIVSNIETGIALSRKCGASFKIATLAGDIFNPGGSMTGGSVQSREFSLLSRERELSELLKIIDTEKKKLIDLNEKKENIKAEAEKAALSMTNAQSAQNDAQMKLQSERDKLSICKTYIDKNALEIEKLEDELSTLMDNLNDIKEEFTRAEEERSLIETESSVKDSDIKLLSAELNKKREETALLSEALIEVKLKLTSKTKENEAQENDLKRAKKELNALKSSIIEDFNRNADLSSDIAKKENKIAEIEEALAAQSKLHEGKASDISKLELEREELSGALEIRRREISEFDSKRAELTEMLHKAELNKNRAELELSNMKDRIMQEYGVTYDEIVTMRRPITVTSAGLRIDELRISIRALGDVNVNAIDDFISVSSRYDTLKTQYDDLVKAESDLAALIFDLEKTIEREFKQQLSVIRENFSNVFVELFGGGRAELIVKDQNDVLNCDIDIIAEPPGKKMSLLSLLSGGERALTAIALLFAMLKLKPTAFCVLDEIETSLDEVNVTNFANYIRNYSDNTQFILITHRKGSMEVCDSLYGVAMEEKGVSKVVSARIA